LLFTETAAPEQITSERSAYFDNNTSQGHFIRHESHMDKPGVEPEFSQLKAGELPPEPW
jgi:hypothetical protein